MTVSCSAWTLEECYNALVVYFEQRMMYRTVVDSDDQRPTVKENKARHSIQELDYPSQTSANRSSLFHGKKSLDINNPILS